MIKHLLLFPFILCLTSYSQSEIKVREILIEKYSLKPNTTYELPNWSFEKNSKLEKLITPTINSQLTSKEFYKADFFFFDDLHGFQSNCIIMFDNIDNSIIILKPIWYSGLSEDFYKNLIGIQLTDKNEIKKFALEFQKFIINDSGKLVLRKTEFGIDSITYKISHEHQKDIFDIIKIILKDNTVSEIQRIDPKDLTISTKIK